jgi:hypothetical protein
MFVSFVKSQNLNFRRIMKLLWFSVKLLTYYNKIFIASDYTQMLWIESRNLKIIQSFSCVIVRCGEELLLLTWVQATPNIRASEKLHIH